MKEKMRGAPSEVLTVKLPSKSVMVPVVVPLTRTVTPGTGWLLLLSTTRPVASKFCAAADTDMISAVNRSHSLELNDLLFIFVRLIKKEYIRVFFHAAKLSTFV